MPQWKNRINSQIVTHNTYTHVHDRSYTHVHDHSLSWFCTDTSIKLAWLSYLYWLKSSLSESLNPPQWKHVVIQDFTFKCLTWRLHVITTVPLYTTCFFYKYDICLGFTCINRYYCLFLLSTLHKKDIKKQIYLLKHNFFSMKD